jgi:hypothetical protein
MSWLERIKKLKFFALVSIESVLFVYYSFILIEKYGRVLLNKIDSPCVVMYRKEQTQFE